MNILKDFQFFTNASTTIDSSICYILNNASTLVIEVTSSTTPTFTVQAKGIVNNSNSTYTILESVNMSTNDVSSTISQVGIYTIPIDGLSNVKISITAISGGSISIYGKLGD